MVVVLSPPSSMLHKHMDCKEQWKEVAWEKCTVYSSAMRYHRLSIYTIHTH